MIAEAMSCGTPVVAFACGGIPEIVAPQGGRLVPPGDVNAMAAAVSAAVALPRIGVHRRAIAHCSASAMVTGYLTIYHDMIEHGSDRAHDRLLHSPPRPRTPQSSYQQLRAAASPGHRADVNERPRSLPFAAVLKLPARGAGDRRDRTDGPHLLFRRLADHIVAGWPRELHEPSGRGCADKTSYVGA